MRENKELPFSLPSKLTTWLDIFILGMYEKNTSNVMIIDGKSGKGKSTLAFQCAKYIDSDFGLHKIHYDPHEFLSSTKGKVGLAQAKQGDCLVFDEALLLSNRSTMSAINKMIVASMSMIRSKNLTIIFCVNSIFDLDKNLAIFRSDLVLHVYGNEGHFDRGKFLAFFKGNDGQDRIKTLYLLGKKYYDYGKPRCNFNSKFSKYFVVDEKEYEAQKQIGINAFLNNPETKGRMEKKYRERFMQSLVIFRTKCNFTIEQLAELLNTSRGNIDKWILELKEEGRL